MRGKSWLIKVCASVFGLVVAAQLWAFPNVARETKRACAACHVNPAGGAMLSEGGKAYQAQKKAPAAAARGAEYVGSARCRMCHMPVHNAWAETPHAKAFVNLQAADEKKSHEIAERLKVELKGRAASTDGCVTCHVTGFQLAGGYPAADSAKTVALAAVGCESCHGPGSLHVSAPMADKKNFINRAVTAKMCTQCHTPRMSPEFKFEEWVKKGVHEVAKKTE